MFMKEPITEKMLLKFENLFLIVITHITIEEVKVHLNTIKNLLDEVIFRRGISYGSYIRGLG